MTIPKREVLRGLVGGAGFLVGLIFLEMPWWLAAAMGLGLYGAVSLFLPAPIPPRPPDWVGLGISSADRDRFVSRCRTSTAELGILCERLTGDRFREQVAGLARTGRSLASYLEKKPESIALAQEVPQNLEQLVSLLRQYSELCEFPTTGPGAAEALRKVEETVGNAALAFEGMHRQLLNEDLAALKASAHSLEFLLGVNPELERERRRRELDQLLAVTRNPPGPPSVRTQQTETPS